MEKNEVVVKRSSIELIVIALLALLVLFIALPVLDADYFRQQEDLSPSKSNILKIE
jgi:hypothetical protein